MLISSRLVQALTLVVACIASAPVGAQLRPLEPFSWHILEDGVTIAADARISRYQGQRASLAGTKGDLWEVPTVAVALVSGRFAIIASGTGRRFFQERQRFGPAYSGVLPSVNGRRDDSGDYTIGTAVRLTPSAAPMDALLRFGTRLPTTRNENGLERDATDFFATLVGRMRRSALSVSLEAGLGITSTRDSSYEQDDLLLYDMRVDYGRGLVRPSVVVVGQAHAPTHLKERRGVEDLSELRFGVNIGGRTWVRLEGIKGLETFSPAYGLSVGVGTLR
ncbi:MAG: hypothetical protein ABIW94_04615 [Gemmatimonadaceae bacterium]